jgi:ribonuclease BN (tRNA processing enzyme)
MKIKMYGTGLLKAKAFSSSAVIDDLILVDCPNGLVRKLRNADFDFDKLKIILMTHFHGDHDFDMPFLLREYNKNTRKAPLTVISPNGFDERYRVMYSLALPEGFDPIYINARLNVIEINDDILTDGIEIDGYKIDIYRVEHGCDAFGYKITKDNKTVAFSGDTCMCKNVAKLLENTNIAFVDITGVRQENSKIHMCIDDLIQLKLDFPKCRVLPTHMGDETREKIKEQKLDCPNDDEVFEI